MLMGTVGAVALDARGCVAVSTSTGGRTNKLPGRTSPPPVPLSPTARTLFRRERGNHSLHRFRGACRSSRRETGTVLGRFTDFSPCPVGILGR